MGSVLPNEELADGALCDFSEETGLTLTPDDFTMLSNNRIEYPYMKGNKNVFTSSRHVFRYPARQLIYALLLRFL
jgi:hypothetical protein